MNNDELRAADIAAAVDIVKRWMSQYDTGHLAIDHEMLAVLRALLQLHGDYQELAMKYMRKCEDAITLSGTTQHCSSCVALATENAELRRVLAGMLQLVEDAYRIMPDLNNYVGEPLRVGWIGEARELLAGEVQDEG